MSAILPIEVQAEIIKRLPVRSLIQYRSVSKSWKSLIDSSGFINDHSLRHTDQPERILVSYKHPNTHKLSYLSFVDDETFPHQRFVPTIPPLVERLFDLSMVGSSLGLLCFYGRYTQPGTIPRYKAVLWNPSIRKSIAISVRNMFLWPQKIKYALGFGVCPVKRDPKIVKIEWGMEFKVEAFSLSTRRWRSLSTNLPHKSIEITFSHVVIDRFIYWFAFVTVSIDEGGFRSSNVILSFDMDNESFEVIDVLDSLLLQSPIVMIAISKLRGSLAVLEHREDNMKRVCDVWVMDHGVQKSFTKLFTIDAPNVSIWKTLGFRKSGEPILETKDHLRDPHGTTAPCVYEPAYESINYLGIYGVQNEFFVNSYVETLLLLNR